MKKKNKLMLKCHWQKIIFSLRGLNVWREIWSVCMEVKVYLPTHCINKTTLGLIWWKLKHEAEQVQGRQPWMETSDSSGGRAPAWVWVIRGERLCSCCSSHTARAQIWRKGFQICFLCRANPSGRHQENSSTNTRDLWTKRREKSPVILFQ